MNNYCYHCDDFTEFTFRKGDPALAPKKVNGMVHYNSGGMDAYICTKCKTQFSYKPKSPPPQRTFIHPCSACGDIEFVWDKDDSWGLDNQSSCYECTGCHTKLFLPDDTKKRANLVKWQKAGCPPPWWLRPTQLAVLISIIALSLWQPFWMIIAYLVFCYGFTGYFILSKGLIFDNSFSAFMFWCFSPVLLPFVMLFFAIRTPVL